MGNRKESLGDRMKCYESVSKTRLVKRMPVIIRIDGKAFHTFTRGFNKPYDVVLSNAMIKTMEALCRNIQGCVFGYTQSDEITLVLVDYRTLTTSAWLDNEVQKICSIAASMATCQFNKAFADEVDIFRQKVYFANINEDDSLKKEYYIDDIETAKKLHEKYASRMHTAMFDARCFNLPKEEVCNCLIWRQQDATRNSIEMLGRAYFSDKELFKKNCSNIQDMLMLMYGVNWNDVETRFKRGTACYKKEFAIDVDGIETPQEISGWFLDYDMPILTQDRDYFEKYILV